jgi:hypothetical protein
MRSILQPKLPKSLRGFSSLLFAVIWAAVLSHSLAQGASVTAKLAVRARVVTSCRLDSNGFAQQSLTSGGRQHLNCASGSWGGNAVGDPRTLTEVHYGVSESATDAGRFTVVTVDF